MKIAFRSLLSPKTFAGLSAALCVGATLVAVRSAHSVAEWQPVIINPPVKIVAGESFIAHVDSTGGPANVHVYSSPAGIGFSGMISSSADVTMTAPATMNGPVTLYCVTDGQTAVSAVTRVSPADDTPLSGKDAPLGGN